MEIKKILAHALAGVRASMEVVRRAQGMRVAEVETKVDETIVTATDRASAEAGAKFLRTTGVPLISEDGEQDKTIAGRYRQFYDPLDGTGAFAAGLMTSTVIWGLYDLERREVIATIVGEPISGRVWIAQRSGPTKLRWTEELGGRRSARLVRVEQGSFSKQSTVVIDLSHGFVRGGRQLLTDVQVGKLFSHLNTRTKILIPGSNGLMHALVANGGTGVVGSITTALGGPWDACGVLLVLRAGGCARAFRFEDGILEERPPRAVADYDILVTGNHRRTVDALVANFRQAIA